MRAAPLRLLRCASLARAAVPAVPAAAWFLLPARSAAASAARGAWALGSSRRGVSAAPATPLKFYVKRASDVSFAEVVVSADESVSALMESALSKLRLDVPPTAVTLTRVGAAAPLVGSQLLAHALAAGLLAPRAELLMQVHAVPRTATAEEAAGAASVARLGEALRAARAEPIAGSESGAALVALPAGVDWPQLGGAPLFVRSFYEGCFEGVLNSLDPSCTAALRKFTIVGNAGIGKSAFGAYVLWRAVQARRTVAYISDKVGDAFILHGDGRAECFPAEDFSARTRSIRRDKTTVLICDGVKPPVVNAFTLLITSPVRERWKEFNKCLDADRLFFPVFSRAEMGDMLRSCYPQLLTDVASGGEPGVWERFGKWGGIPRYVLGKVNEDAQLGMDSVVTRFSVDVLMSHLGAREIESDDAVSHRLMHLKPTGEAADGTFVHPRDAASYIIARSELGSPYIKELVYRAMDARDFSRIEVLLARSPKRPIAARLYGDVFERAALDALSQGGSFPRFDLSAGKEAGSLVLRPSNAVVFTAAPDLAASLRGRDAAALAATIFVPKADNYTGVDAVLGDGKALVNFTINTAHDLKAAHATRVQEGPAALAGALGFAGGTEIHFYWALPQARYLEMCKKGASNSVRLPLAGGGEVTVRQFALCLPFGAAANETGAGSLAAPGGRGRGEA